MSSEGPYGELQRRGAPRGPGRRDRRVLKTQRALKDALTSLILEMGYDGVTVQDVIDRADVGRSTFYAHYLDKDELLMAIFADLEVPGPDPTTWRPDDPPFCWTIDLFRHFEAGRRLFRAVAGSESGSLARRETDRWLDGLARAELARLGVMKRHEPMQLEIVARFIVGTLLGFMGFWMREEYEHLPAETINEAFRALVLPGVAGVLGLDPPPVSEGVGARARPSHARRENSRSS